MNPKRKVFMTFFVGTSYTAHTETEWWVRRKSSLSGTIRWMQVILGCSYYVSVTSKVQLTPRFAVEAVLVPTYILITFPALKVLLAVNFSTPTVDEATNEPGAVSVVPIYGAMFKNAAVLVALHLTCWRVPAKGIAREGIYAPVVVPVQVVVVAVERTNERVGEIRPLQAFVESYPTIFPVEVEM